MKLLKRIKWNRVTYLLALCTYLWIIPHAIATQVFDGLCFLPLIIILAVYFINELVRGIK